MEGESARANLRPVIGFSLLLLVVLLGITGWSWWRAREDRDENARAVFAYETTALRAALLARMEHNEVALLSGRGLVAGSERVTRDEWHRFVAAMQIERTLPGVHGLGFIERVTREELAAHTAGVRRDGFPDYDVWPRGARDLYMPVVYLEPFAGRNRRAFGYDMFSEPTRRQALVRAMDSGETAVSARVQLVQDAGDEVQAGFLMYVPVYRPGAAIDTREQRRAALLGVVYSPFRVDDFMRAAFLASDTRVALELYDGAIVSPDALMYRPPGNAFLRRARFSATEIVEVGGQAWTLRFASTPAFESSLRQQAPEFILFGGTAISLLTLGVALALITGRRRALALAARMTQELRRTNEKLTRQALELERSNEELEQFAYVASHDLHEPLRTVTSFTQLIEDEYGERLDADARRYMGYIVEGNRRMKQLIDDLLELSRVGSRPAPHGPVNSAEVVQEAAHGLSQAIEDSRAALHCEELPVVLADRGQLVQLFQNLIGNALKFRSGEPPRIAISAKRDAEWWQFAVADNGIGIERKYFDRIFVMFQRLHGRAEYSGTGIGLAICKKIVERHGGLIWVESEPGKGATFCFTLRAADEVR